MPPQRPGGSNETYESQIGYHVAMRIPDHNSNRTMRSIASCLEIRNSPVHHPVTNHVSPMLLGETYGHCIILHASPSGPLTPSNLTQHLKNKGNNETCEHARVALRISTYAPRLLLQYFCVVLLAERVPIEKTQHEK